MACAPTPQGSRGGSGRGKQGLSKKYGQGFVWGQLSGWYKQTVYDPTASLSAERRGTLSMPDIESAFPPGTAKYTRKVPPLPHLPDTRFGREERGREVPGEVLMSRHSGSKYPSDWFGGMP